ncbi:MAG: VWA domain-containing protein [Bryobacteraceae bacterium]|nr:VWA domain-containing protein [Bryobacteraceae bacterium]
MGIGLLLPLLLLGQEAEFRAEKKLVRVAVRTADARGLPIPNLGPNDFRVVEDDQEIQAESVSQEELPLDIALVLDVSYSMRVHLKQLAGQARTALQILRPDDRVAIYTFAGRTRLELDLTQDHEAAARQIDRVARGNLRPATVLFTPIFTAANHLRQTVAKDRRRAILMVSDGRGMRGKSEAETLAALWEADATAYLLTTREAAKVSEKQTFLQGANVPALLEKAGGEWMSLQSGGSPFADALRRIRAHYTSITRPITRRAPAAPSAAKCRWDSAQPLRSGCRAPKRSDARSTSFPSESR